MTFRSYEAYQVIGYIYIYSLRFNQNSIPKLDLLEITISTAPDSDEIDDHLAPMLQAI
jgi:hypothetical protein